MSKSIQQLLDRSLPFRKLEKAACADTLPLTVTSAPDSVRPELAEALHRKTHRTVVVLTESESTAREYAARSAHGAMFLPDADFTLRDVQGRNRDGQMQRLSVLKRAADADVIYMSITAAMQRVIPKDVLEGACVSFTKGGVLRRDKIEAILAEAAYERVGTVYSPGEFAVRGEVLDLFPADSDMPLRITLFDDEIEAIRYFDTETQKSIGKEVSEAVVPPAREIVLDKVAKARLERYLSKQKGQLAVLGRELSQEMKDIGVPGNVQTLLSAIYPPVSPLQYFDDSLVIWDGYEKLSREAERVAEEYGAEYDRLMSENEVLPAQADGLLPLNALLDGYEHRMIDLAAASDSPLSASEHLDLRIRSTLGFNGRIQILANMISRYADEGGHVYLFAGKRAMSLARALSDNGIEAPIAEKITGTERITIVPERLQYGFELSDTHTLVLGEIDIYGHAKKRVANKKKKTLGDDIFSDLKPGDIVVEDTHGKGRYLGLTTMKTDNVVGEYMAIEYRDGAKLYISAANVDSVQKYVGSDDGNVILSKLGGQEWSRAKKRVRESTKKLAFDMVKLYASRYKSKGHAFSADTVWQKEFEDAFPYEETDGQLQSIEEIKKDMESPRAMDRLLLGDVGYGKTEVAMRAAFKAVMDGKQVAVLVPTTLLARQHLNTFRERFEKFGVNVAGLSRFAKGDHKKILEDLRTGKTDIIIGTHRLLSKDVKFNDLGLLIVDEEQRFGVNHKERIKTLKNEVDVLTLSATPIPRTLEMSLTGIRDMSTIETPPAMKKQPYTYVTKYTEGVLHDAVTRELKRNGQVYVVCRQIQQMDKIIADVRRAAPHARICAAHGQMPESEIEDIVSRFIDREYDVLVCTTIIENGIDIPNVNTIVVYESDMFGLSQLYQLKGRVGRGDLTSYAYFTYNKDKQLNENAERRLQAIREFAELGSGFKIAMRDLQIRGAGSLLGAEQSGHMATVGYAMYCRMMNEAVAEARGKPVQKEIETTVELGIPAFIPDSYVSSQADKMDIYRLISRIRSIADAKSVLAEMKDRYGKPPKEVDNLILAAVVRCYASRAGFAQVVHRKGAVEMRYADGYVPDVDKLLRITENNPKLVTLKPMEPPMLLYRTNSVPGKRFLEFVASLGTAEKMSEPENAMQANSR